MTNSPYKGKRLTVTMPMDVWKILDKLANKDDRTASQMTVFLLKEAMKARGELEDPD